MPKVKTNRGAAKRFRVTGSGLIKRGKAFRRHILTKKSTARKRDLRQGAYAAPSDVREMRELLPGL